MNPIADLLGRALGDALAHLRSRMALLDDLHRCRHIKLGLNRTTRMAHPEPLQCRGLCTEYRTRHGGRDRIAESAATLEA